MKCLALAVLLVACGDHGTLMLADREPVEINALLDAAFGVDVNNAMSFIENPPTGSGTTITGSATLLDSNTGFTASDLTITTSSSGTIIDVTVIDGSATIEGMAQLGTHANMTYTDESVAVRSDIVVSCVSQSDGCQDLCNLNCEVSGELELVGAGSVVVTGSWYFEPGLAGGIGPLEGVSITLAGADTLDAMLDPDNCFQWSIAGSTIGTAYCTGAPG